MLLGEVYDLTGLGDRTTFAMFSTLDFAEQQTVQIGHDFRVGSEDTIVFANKLRGLGQRVMFCTGSSPSDLRELVGDVPVVGKPFTEQQLLDAVALLVQFDSTPGAGSPEPAAL